jgi:DHA1 family inner membrane transport protein
VTLGIAADSPGALKRRVARWQHHAPEGEFWKIVASTALYNCALASFLFLYNLYMLDRGFTERPLGVLTSAAILGTVVGTVPVAALAARFALRKLLVPCVLLIAVVSVVKAGVASYTAQLVLDFVGGLLICGWSVCLSPLVASVVEVRKRPTAFSILYAVAIVSCGLGGFIGGHMPGWWERLALSHHRVLLSIQYKQLTLATMSLVLATAVLPVLHMHAQPVSKRPATLFWPSPMLIRIFVASACWSLAIGCINPFIAVFFTRTLGMALGSVGTFFSVSQILEAGAVLATPWLLRRMSLVAGIMTTQMLAASSLMLLAASHSWRQAAVTTFGFLAAQHMSEPGMQTLLMNHAGQAQRSTASAMFSFVNASASAVAAAVGGAALGRYGYPPVLVAAAFSVLGAVVLLRHAGGPVGILEPSSYPVEAPS